MYHYNYRITNIKKNKHYYGTRSSKIKPLEDIGYIYFSSSSDKEFIDDQKNNPLNYKYKVVHIFDSRKKALKLEIKLHKKFDVGVNESFYNKVIQTSTGFDATGLFHSEETKQKIRSKIYTKDECEARSIRVMGIKNPMYNKNHSEETKQKISLSKKGTKASDEMKLKMSKSRTGSHHHNAKHIVIFDNNNNEMFNCYHGIRKFLKENSLPPRLENTYRENSILAKGPHKGWYAREI